MSMYLDVFDENDFGTNCWLLSAEGSDDAVVVDPGFSPERVHEMLRAAGKRPVAVLATHGHWDHVGSAGAFCGDELPLYIHEADRLALTDPAAWGAGMPVPRTPVHDIRTVVEGDKLDFAGFSIEVVHTPGHTPGSVCFATDGRLFSGDLVFRGSIGRHDFPNSSAEDMEQSLRRFLTLPDPLPVYPGHGPETTVGTERRANPFLVELR
jgi:glyoxylase-like metal-dependent hydrolase (beta-lactamase superfamily II)